MNTKSLTLILLFFIQIISISFAQIKIDKLEFIQPESISSNVKINHYDFKGYTDRWDKYSWNFYTYAGIYQMAQNELSSELAQMEMYIGNQLILEELYVQKGFVSKLADNKYTLFVNNFDKNDIEAKLNQNNVLIVANDRNSLIKEIVKKLPEELQYRRNKAFYLQYSNHYLFIITSPVKEEIDRLYGNIKKAENIVKNYNLYKGLAGVNTFYYLITQHPENPYDIIDKALQLGCSWMMISGYNDYMIPDEVNRSLSEIKKPFIFLPGQYVTGGVMYGMKNYPDVQDNTMKQCLDWAEKYKGYYFAYTSGYKDKQAKRFSGYIVNSDSDQKLIDSLNVPFITNAGSFTTNYPSSMLLFLDKNKELNEQSIMEAIMHKKAVAVFEKAAMLGPDSLRDGLRILLLEQDYLENQLMSPIALSAQIDNNKTLTILAQNRTNKIQYGSLNITSHPFVKIDNNINSPLIFNPHETKLLKSNINILSDGYGKDNPINISIDINGKTVRTLNHIKLPDAIEIHSLLINTTDSMEFPFSVWAFESLNQTTVKLDVFHKSSGIKILSAEKKVDINANTKTISSFNIKLDTGIYIAKISFMGFTKEGIISIKNFDGNAKVYIEDLNHDSIPEIVMENDNIKATVLLFGGRIIEYILKNKDENLLFKLWPNRPPWHGKPEGFRAFYPYGGLEEFIGYPFIGGQVVYDYKILKSSGNYVRVKVWANIHGSKIEKTFTLFGNSEILQTSYAFNDMDENIKIIGINPLIQIGPSTGPEDEYYFPTTNGLEKRNPVMDRYYGNTFFLKEGWAAGYDTKLKISLLVGYPVNDAMLFHLWNNHPNNKPTPYYYTELQPWILIKHGQTNYFSYYLLGNNGTWEIALEKFKKLGLMTEKVNK